MEAKLNRLGGNSIVETHIRGRNLHYSKRIHWLLKYVDIDDSYNFAIL